jgi:predicted small secreted protein
MTNVRRFLLLFLLAGFSVAVAGCGNTIRGIGRDIEKTGDAIEDAAS